MTAHGIEWLFSLEHLGMKFGLENITRLLAALDDPQDAFASVHVAGTNGKGSVTAVVEAALRKAGYRSARFTSPHLERVEERFVIQGHEVDTGALDAALTTVRTATDRLLAARTLEAPPTFFEATTAAAFELFRRHEVDVAVVEVGLGGRLDSTNVISPLVCAITTIGFDHQALLGDTLAQIAAEKAGIIKPRTPVVIGRLPGDAEAVIAEVARGLEAPVVHAAEYASRLEGVEPGLRGAHQRDNALVALATIDVLGGRGFPVTAADARFAVEHVGWPGRLEHVRCAGREVILDAAHNPEGAQALAAYIREIGWEDATLVFGAMADKNISGMLDALLPAVARVITTTPPTPRAAPAESVAAVARTLNSRAIVAVEVDPRAALELACRVSPRVVVAGSMFLIGPLRGILR